MYLKKVQYHILDTKFDGLIPIAYYLVAYVFGVGLSILLLFCIVLERIEKKWNTMSLTLSLMV